MAGATLHGIGACVFDAYGTLFNVNSATASSLKELGDRADALNRIWREKQLQYSWLRAAQGRHADFWQVTRDALDFAFDSLGFNDPALRERLMGSWLLLEPFAEVPVALRRLKGAGFKLAILSNGTPAMLQSAMQNAKLEGLFDAVLSVEEAGVYKPHPDVYRLAVQRLGMAAGEIAFISSNGWDAYAASAFGLRVIWCNRYGQQPERLPGNPDIVLPSLAQLPSCIAVKS